MNKKKSKEISDYLDRRIIICNAVKEPINKDLDCAIKLSVAYEELQQENTNLKQALNEIREICNGWIYGNEDFCIKSNEDILQIIDKVLGEDINEN